MGARESHEGGVAENCGEEKREGIGVGKDEAIGRRFIKGPLREGCYKTCVEMRLMKVRT
jgi:hypothetical protein